MSELQETVEQIQDLIAKAQALAGDRGESFELDLATGDSGISTDYYSSYIYEIGMGSKIEIGQRCLEEIMDELSGDDEFAFNTSTLFLNKEGERVSCYRAAWVDDLPIISGDAPKELVSKITIMLKEAFESMEGPSMMGSKFTYDPNQSMFVAENVWMPSSASCS